MEGGIFGGVFDGKFFNAFRGDKGDAEAAARRAARDRAKAAADQAFADSMASDLGSTSVVEGIATGNLVRDSGGNHRPQVNVADTPAFRKLRSKTIEMANRMKDQSKAIAEMREDIEVGDAESLKTRKYIKKMADRLEERFKQSSKTQGMISDSLLSAANGVLSVINVNDVAPNKLFKVLEAVLTGLVASDWAEGQTEKWLRLAALGANIGAYYDPEVGFASLFQTDEGSIIPSTSTTTPEPTTNTGSPLLDAWLATQAA